MSINPVVNYFEIPISGVLKDINDIISPYRNHLILLTLLISIAFVLLRKTTHILISIALTSGIVFLIGIEKPSSLVLTGLLLPTLIHVYLFTLLFIFFGAVKSKSKYGIVLEVIVLLVPFIIVNMDIKNNTYKITQNTLGVFIKSSVGNTLSRAADLLGLIKNKNINICQRAIVKNRIFISIVYTYHFLNWFSETFIIG